VTTTIVAGIAPLAVLQWIAVGTPLGLRVGANFASSGSHLAERTEVFYKLMMASTPDAWTSLAVSAPFLLLMFSNPALSERALRWTLPIVALVGLVAGLVSLRGFLTTPSPIEHLLRSNSLFPAAPLILLGVVRPALPAADPRGRAASTLWAVAAAYAVLYALATPLACSGGIHWGNRFLLIVYPLLAVLAARNVAAWWAGAGAARRPGALAAAALIVLSLGAQLYAVHLLRSKKEFSSRLNAQIAARSEPVILTDVWWAPPEMFAVFGDKPIFFLSSASRPRISSLKRQLIGAGYDTYLWVTRPSSATVTPDAEIVEDGGLAFFRLALSAHRLY
jgi:hypothetical protein